MHRTAGWLSGVVCGLAIAIPSGPLPAQQIAVQQPAIGMFSGSTTISVPDRGRALIGGVGQSASSSSRYGPIRTNTNYGRSTVSSGMSARVWIQDFEELDRQTLAAAEGARSRAETSPPVSRADRAYESLRRRGIPGFADGSSSGPAELRSGSSRHPAAASRGTAGADARKPRRSTP